MKDFEKAWEAYMRVQKQNAQENCSESYDDIICGLKESKGDVEEFIEFIEEEYDINIQIPKQR